MEFFKIYHSNTLAAGANQSYFEPENADEVITGRVYYKIYSGGCFNYSFLFSNIIDSTFADGSHSYKNLICDEWSIVRAAVCVADECDGTAEGFKQLYFEGKTNKKVKPGELFVSEPIELCFEKGQYLCLEIMFNGRMIPYHPESQLAMYTEQKGEWIRSVNIPLPSMVGCDKRIDTAVAYIGDSITQGIGVAQNSYLHWNALLSDMLPDSNAYWNLGIGFGRAEDAASDGAWLFKAKQNDAVAVCYGVNDILQGRTEKQINEDLTNIVTALKKNNIKVLLQTIPPFDYKGEQIVIWENLNRYIKDELSNRVDSVFDVVPVLQENEEHPYNAKYGGHPNEQGSRLWAEALYPVFLKFLENK